ncbi:MAG TPA: hypothetical protein VF635_12835, partial [Propionibacteriaceae bacterium]
SERTVWGMGDGSTLPVIDTPYGRLRTDLLREPHALGPLLPLQPGCGHLGRPTLAPSDGWVAAMRHIALEGRCYGRVLAGPAKHQGTILYADVDLAAVHASRRFFDPVGHYSRPDIFQLRVDTSSRRPVVTYDPAHGETPAGPAPKDRRPRGPPQHVGSRSTPGSRVVTPESPCPD